jgi:peptidoglycan/LPS O-acetylase OafA/YrhL
MRIRELDGLRGIAILAVVATHYLSWLPATGAQYGFLGVDLFFILSGFLITTILMGQRKKQNYFSRFYSRRALRIFPLYYLAIFIYLGISINTGQVGSFKMWVSYFIFCSSLGVGQPTELKHSISIPISAGLGVLWSLSVEELYYTIWAPIVRWSSQEAFKGILFSLVIIAPVLRWMLHTSLNPELYSFYCRMDALALGSMVALAISKYGHEVNIRQNYNRRWKIATVLISFFTVSFWVFFHNDRDGVLISTFGISLADLSFALIVYGIVLHTGSSFWWARILRTRSLRSLGKVSYSLYLFHYVVYVYLGYWITSWGLGRKQTAATSVVVSFCISLGIAYATWFLLESPLQRWKDRNVPADAGGLAKLATRVATADASEAS